jgi:hypothetical protein
MENAMTNLNKIFTLTAVSLALVSGAAFADTGKTLAQSQAEAVAARQSGDIPMGFAAVTERDVFYGNAVSTVPAGKSAQAGAQGGDVPLGFAAKTEREIYAGNASAGGKTREQVQAEAIAARDAGDVPVGFVARTEREINAAPQGGDLNAVHEVAGGASSNATR